jgi:hypothetical protein
MSKSLGQRKDQRARWRIIFQAAACTLLFHLFLAFGFVYKTPPPVEPQGRPLFNYMVAQDSQNVDVVQLNIWLKYHDPTLFIKPSRKYGFSSTPHRSRFDVRPEDRADMSFPDALMRPGHILKLPAFTPTSAVPLAGYVPTPPRPGYVELSTITAPQSYPALLDRQKRILLSPVVKSLNLKGVNHATELKIIVAEKKLLPRVVLRKTCGRRDLDLLAVNLVLKACIAGKIDAHKKQDISMIWSSSVTGGGK